MLITILDKYKKNKLIINLLAGLWLYFFIQKLFLHFGFHTDYFDLYFFDHSIWNVTQGRGLYLSIGSFAGNYLGAHFNPYLYLVAVFYFIKATPVWLFFFHSLVLVIGTYPILKIAEIKFAKKGIMATFILLLFYISFRKANFHDFHGEILMFLFVSWIAYMLFLKKMKYVWILALLIPFVKETVFTFLVALGIFLILVQKKYWQGLIIIGYGLMVGYLLVDIIVPSLGQFDYGFLDYYNYLGDSIGQKIITLLTRPDIVLKNVLQGYKIGYLLLLFLPIGFLSFFSPYLILGLGTFAQNLLANKLGTADVMEHYTIPLVPVIFISAILGLYYLKNKSGKIVNIYLKIAKGFVVFFIIINVVAFIFLDLRAFYIDRHTIDSYKALKKIPKDAYVCASTHYFPHLEYRENIELFPYLKNADYVIVEGMDPFYPVQGDHGAYIRKKWQQGQKLSVIKALLLGERGYSPVNRKKYFKALRDLINNPNYRLLDKGKGVYLFSRNLMDTSGRI